MAPRANWKGYLKLSLVSCAVALYPASSSSARVSFHTLNRETGNRLKRQMVDADTGEVVDTEDQIKGYEVSKGEYVTVEDGELDEIAIESTHTIDIERFVPRSEIDELYLDTPYYIAPDDRVAEEAFAVIRDAMKSRDMVGLARVVLYRRERILMLEPREKGLYASTLRFAYEVRDAKPYFEDIPDIALPEEMLDLAGHIIEKKAGHFEPASFEDRYENAVIALVKSKQAGTAPMTLPTAPKPSNVVNLMDALRKSVGGGSDGGKKGSNKSEIERKLGGTAPERAKIAAKTSRNSPTKKSDIAQKPALAEKPAPAPSKKENVPVSTTKTSNKKATGGKATASDATTSKAASKPAAQKSDRKTSYRKTG